MRGIVCAFEEDGTAVLDQSRHWRISSGALLYVHQLLQYDDTTRQLGVVQMDPSPATRVPGCIVQVAQARPGV